MQQFPPTSDLLTHLPTYTYVSGLRSAEFCLTDIVAHLYIIFSVVNFALLVYQVALIIFGRRFCRYIKGDSDGDNNEDNEDSHVDLNTRFSFYKNIVF